jgi:hypothetical protein
MNTSTLWQNGDNPPEAPAVEATPAHADSKGQPAPTGNGASVTDAVVADMLYRREHGIVKYGTELRANNGRDALSDAYQEALDLAVYLKQALMERDAETMQRWIGEYD